MNKVVVLLTMLGLLTACGEATFESVKHTCTVTSTDIVCPDGSTMPLPQDGVNGAPGVDGIDGRDGIDGIDGQDGAPGTLIDIIDPCGDDPNNPDEVLLRFDNNLFLAWYKNLGFSVLQPGVIYVTTDKQKCKFEIVGNAVVAL